MAEDDFWGPLGSQNDKASKSVDEILKADQKDLEAEKVEKDKEKRKRILLGGAGAGALAVMVTAALLINPFANDLTDKTVKKEQATSASKQTEKPAWYEDQKKIMPVDVPSYEDEANGGITIRADKIPDGVKNQVKSVWGGTYAETLTTATLPSEAQGWTADTSKAVNKDGSLNVLFTYWTSDLFLEQSTVQVSRLLNPNYGGWGQYQFPESKPSAKFNPLLMDGVFSHDYLKAMEQNKDKSSIPVYADWNANNYGLGDQLLTQGQASYRWVGEVTGDPNVKFVYDAKTLNYKANVTYPVTFTAFTQSQNKVTRSGTLNVTFVADVSGGGNPGAFRVLVGGGKLTVK